mmetsp:Transcript_19838/g.43071  ORF Transcript_19838/g.43071 Transcript_19838/m.43071 type:complete len:177 (+) Transcript_19838:76-606(+)|eukprot:CAMPEP_0206457828 /NCGR_PEP_ID=MMETSP0324_2-20121206/23198_1 /ASSEMBLY_ACC=CAM_ASM_000836 /TAXON_ID=2866 /ORGANISM="Crypthecodinium cohnii, Strain Seligo" /LENGTH=176 /DNA_ID=CAMNT_0053929033 /DNA_START=71 /DNA_END=601 /DNA_ORIENTATION=-
MQVASLRTATRRAGVLSIASRRCFASDTPTSGGSRVVQGVSGPSTEAAESWRADKEKYWQLYQLPGGRQQQRDFKMGPYAHTMRKDPKTGKLTPIGKFFVSPREDPVSFVVNCLLAFVTIYSISQLSWGESFFEKRRRVIRERIRQEYGLPKGWEHDIEDEGDLELSEESPGAKPE